MAYASQELPPPPRFSGKEGYDRHGISNFNTDSGLAQFLHEAFMVYMINRQEAAASLFSKIYIQTNTPYQGTFLKSEELENYLKTQLKLNNGYAIAKEIASTCLVPKNKAFRLAIAGILPAMISKEYMISSTMKESIVDCENFLRKL